MHIKRFEAPTLLEAIRLVKAELGPDALILSQRKVRGEGGMFGLLERPRFEVTAAVDREVRRGAPPEPAPVPAARFERAEERVGPDPSWQGFQLSRALVDPLEAELRAVRRAVEQLAGALPPADELASDLAGVQRAAADLRRASADLSEPIESRLATRLLDAGIAPRHAFPLAREASVRPADDGGEPLRDALAARLDRRLVPQRTDTHPRAELFVGPTGAGKTTTLAKLAARPEEGPGRLALVTTDAHRLGAEASLRLYAERLGASFHTAVSSQELVRAIDGERGSRVLVDTAGRGPTDRDAVSELLACRGALGRDARVHLVVSATTKEEDLRRDLRRYAPLRADGLVVAKVDESERLGNVVNLLLDDDAPPLAWLADGQRVPDDLRVPDPWDLAGRVLGA